MSEAPAKRTYDAVVVGAGVVGLACAWRAAQRGLSVLVLERAQPGAGASGVAAGMLAPVTEAEFGEQALLRLNLESAALWPDFSAELEELSGLGTGFRRSGALLVAADRDDAEELRRLHAFQRSLGLDSEWLSGRDCRRLEPGLAPRVAGGVLAAGDSHADPPAVLAALAAALRNAGGELAAGCEVMRVVASDERVEGVETSAGRVAASAVVVAAGCWSGAREWLPGGLRPPVRPVKGQLLGLRVRNGAPPPAERIVRTPRCYVLTRADGRVVVGATVEERGFDESVTAEGVFRLLEAAWEVLPDVLELELERTRAGLRPGTPDNAPLIGAAAPEGLIFATGHYRNGVLLAPATAAAVTALLSGEEPELELAPFTPDRFASRVAA